MWGIAFLMLAWGSASALAQSGVMGRLSWCSTLCMCETATKTEVQCFEEDDVYQLLDFDDRAVARMRRVDSWSLESRVLWCTDMCLCNIQTGKQFSCTQPHKIMQLIANRIGTEYFMPEEDSEIIHETERSVDEDEGMAPRKKSRGGRKKNKNRNPKNKPRKHRKSEATQEPEPEPEPTQPEPEPEPELHIPTTSVTPMTTVDTPTSTSVTYHHEEDAEEIDVHEHHEPLPRQEAVAASPAIQTPSRRPLPYSTAESYTPPELEGLSPRVQPVVEVPKEKKTVASMVSQDLDDLGSTVRNIKNDVMFNQRILLVTVAIAGIAMLGVLILAIMVCTTRRQQAANNAKKNSSKEGNHSPKINLEEAW